MALKNILFVVNDIEKSVRFYKELFGLQVIRDFGNNVILSEGLVLQERKSFEELIGKEISSGGNDAALYFVESDLEAFAEKLKNSFLDVQYVHELKEYDWGQRAIRIYDPDQHMIEIGEMM